MANCTDCKGKMCYKGNLEGAPEGCPSKATTPEKEMARYDEQDLMMAKNAALVEAFGYVRLTRIEEIMEYAARCGYKRFGLAFCMGLAEESRLVADVFRANGFEVESVCCKCGSVDKRNIGVEAEEFVSACAEFEGMCNPAGQAAILNEAGVDLSIMCGLCVGHDSIFIKHCKTPVTVLVSKDRVTGHSPLAPIYTIRTYRSNLYTYMKRRQEQNK